MIVVGAEKVPRWVYKNVDYNVSIGTQPHSEIAALAVFMDRLVDGEMKEKFKDAEIEVTPSEQDKLTEKRM
jgi:tRNA (cytidine56-2'-O)-methyltransferase